MNENNCHVEFDDLADRYAAEIRQGSAGHIEDYVVQYPQHAAEIRRLFPVLQMMEEEAVAVAMDDSEADLLREELGQLDASMNKQLGDYRLVREIGRGGMGLVFEAHQQSLERRVALKLLPDSARFDARRLQRFQQEAMSAAQLHHTNIVPVFGIGTHRETAYFVMQYIEGPTLDAVMAELSRIRTGGARNSTRMNADTSTLASTIASNFISVEIKPATSSVPSVHSRTTGSSVDETPPGRPATTMIDPSHSDRALFRNIASLGIQVADALAYAHSRNILHRDIKPTNLMIDLEGNAWVTDFGLAKSLESPDLTRTGEVVGTLRYMSPEQLNGRADARSDIFGLGLTLYELAALQPAYDSSDRAELMQQAIEATPPRLRSINSDIPRDLETIIHKCIASEPEKRYQNATELGADLERFRRGEPILARRINPLQRLAKWCRRQPLVASLAASLLLTMLAGIAGVTSQWQKTVAALELASSNLAEAISQRQQTADALSLAEENLVEARRQTEIAQGHFRQARESVDKFFTVIGQQRLLQEPGLQGLRKELLQEAVDYHQEFVAQYQDDVSLRAELGQSIFFISNIEHSLDASSSPEQIDEAIAIFEELSESEPGQATHRLWLARCLSSKGRLLRRIDARAGLQLVEKAAGLFEQIVAEYPENVTALDELAKTYQSLGLAYESMERATETAGQSLDYYTRAYEIRSKMTELLPEDVTNTTLFGDVHRDLAIAYRRNGDLETAKDFYARAHAIVSDVVAAHPDNMSAQKTLGSIANSIAYFYCHGGGKYIDFDVALKFYDLSLRQYQSLSENNPMIFEFKDGLARAALGAGSIYQVRKQWKKALETRQFAADIREKLCEQYPQAFHLRSSWAMSLNGLGSTLRDMGEIERAIEVHRQAHDQHQQAVAIDPQMPVVRLRLITGLLQLSRVQASAESFEQALATIKQVDDYTLPGFSKPRFDKGVELTLLACKVANKQPNEDDTDGESRQELIEQCLDLAKLEFAAAHEMQFDVQRAAVNHVDLPKFEKQYAPAAEMMKWIRDELQN